MRRIDVLRNQFPFAGWDEKLAKNALAVLASGDMIPVQRLNELTHVLQKPRLTLWKPERRLRQFGQMLLLP